MAESQAQFTVIFLLAKEPIYSHLYPTQLSEEHPALTDLCSFPITLCSHHLAIILSNSSHTQSWDSFCYWQGCLASHHGQIPYTACITKSPIKMSKSARPMHQPLKNTTENKHSIKRKHEEHLLAWPLAPRKMDMSYLFPNLKYFGIHPKENNIPSLFWQKYWIWNLETWFVNLTSENLRTFHCFPYHTCLYYFWLLLFIFFFFAITIYFMLENGFFSIHTAASFFCLCNTTQV